MHSPVVSSPPVVAAPCQASLALPPPLPLAQPTADNDAGDSATSHQSTSNKRRRATGTQEEVEAYALELGLPASDGTAMFDHWTANGWMHGRRPCKDWRAGLRNWRAHGWLPSQNRRQQQSTPPSSKSQSYPHANARPHAHAHAHAHHRPAPRHRSDSANRPGRYASPPPGTTTPT